MSDKPMAATNARARRSARAAGSTDGIAPAVVRDREACWGLPSLAGTRIGVHHVVGYARAYRGDLTRVQREALPDLSLEQIEAAMRWYGENVAEIDAILEQSADRLRGI